MQIKRVKIRNYRKRVEAMHNAITSRAIEPYVLVPVNGKGIKLQNTQNREDWVMCGSTEDAYARALHLVQHQTEAGVRAALPFNTLADQMGVVGII